MDSPRKVLIVDDDDHLCYILSAGLRLKGWNPEAVGTFGDALVAVRSGFDVVLLDPGLPDSMPVKTIQDLGRLKPWANRIYIITGAPIDDALHKLCMESGATGVMSKNAQEFLAGITEVFGK